MKNFALIGAAGYVAPRHMNAIKLIGHQMIAALDKSDSVGIIDTYFPNASFFTEFERFDRHLDRIRRRDPQQAVNYVSICSPNFLHDSHVRYALRSGADAICEKPLVLNPWNIDAMLEMEAATGQKVNTILQLRTHPKILELRDRISRSDRPKYKVDLTYITSRGVWYLFSWKGDVKRSGGIATNIGVHFFDMLHFLFGNVQSSVVHLSQETRAAGYIEYDRASVRWFLSVDESDIPELRRAAGQRTFRSIEIDGEDIDFSSGFTDLHTRSYELILKGSGFGIEENRSAITTVAAIRSAQPAIQKGERHPFVQSMKVIA